jgi:H+/Cl- antiporter ClcA
MTIGPGHTSTVGRVTTSERSPSTQGASLGGKEYLRLVGLAAAVGIPAALVAALFLAVVHDVEHWLWHTLPSHYGHSLPPWYLVLTLPVVGAVITWGARRYLPGDGGEQPLIGIKLVAMPWRLAAGVAVAAVGSLSFGAVLGPEAPVIALGAVVGGLILPYVRLNARQQQVITTAGIFSAVSALFGGPLVAGVLLLESGVGLGAAVIPALLPGLVAAAIGYVLFVGLGSWGGLDAVGLTVPDLPVYQGTRIVDLFLAVAVGVVVTLIIVPIRRAAAELDRRGLPRLGILGLLVVGALAVGILAEINQLAGGSSQDVLFSGQFSVPTEVSETSLGLLLLLVVTKALAYAVSLGCGFRGGPVFPAIFLGVGVASIAVVLFDSSPTWAIAVGTAAGMTGGTRLLFSALVLALVLCGTAGLDAMPAAVLAAAAAWITRQALDPLVSVEPTAAPS